MKFFVLSLFFVFLFWLPACESAQETVAPESQAAVISVYKTPTCGCCTKWVDHLREKGFTVETHDQPSLTALKQEQGVPHGTEACHTALVDGYVIEGHVPAREITRLLEERPRVRGLVVPGMPLGSPGMEADRTESYSVLAFDDTGSVSTFARYE
ncbi:MAG: DUF411 domain-containing protein [Myxococcota bacterium]|nr:DUF411 domain-containing protein [Myxococcota bacterium]